MKKLQVLKSQVLNFLLGEYFTDALRNTLVIVLPIVILFLMGQQQAAVGTGVGVLLISLTDLPGNRMQKFKTAYLSIGVFFFTSLIFTSVMYSPVYTAMAFLGATFLLSMLSLLGARAALTGTMAIILSTFLLGLHPRDPILFSIYILVGASWFYLVSLVQISMFPYRSLDHAVFECIKTTADFLRIKARCYDPEENLEDCYREAISLHFKISSKQDQVRTLLLSDKKAMKQDHPKGRQMLRKSIRVIELYEQITAIHYDYNEIRKGLSGSAALALIVRLIYRLADELDELNRISLIPAAKRRNITGFNDFGDLMVELRVICGYAEEDQRLILNRILRNLADIDLGITALRSDALLDQQGEEQLEDLPVYQRFLPAVSMSTREISADFSLKSPIFRFSLRLALTLCAAYILTLVFPSEKYSYWMLLTIVIVARPRFAMTWKRNKERLLGTAAGLVAAFLMLIFLKSVLLILVFSGVFLLGFFAFNRLNYAISVACITPSVILCLSIYHGHSPELFTGRLYYTLAGCAFAFAGVYLFPVWERGQLKQLIGSALSANQIYLDKVLDGRSQSRSAGHAQKLARKNAHTQIARLSESMQYMLMEPGSKIFNVHAVYSIQSLIFRINSVITSVLLADIAQNIDSQLNLLHSLSTELELEMQNPGVLIS